MTDSDPRIKCDLWNFLILVKLNSRSKRKVGDDVYSLLKREIEVPILSGVHLYRLHRN
jgi:hypothetical protein